MSTLLYVAGAPGAGKSTLMAEITRACARTKVGGSTAHEVLSIGGRIAGVELGARRENFSGTDAMPMHAHTAALEWIAGRPYPLVLGEGTRLMTLRFLTTARDAGYEVLVASLEASDDLAAGRRAARGSTQNAAWVRGATSRAANYVKAANGAGFTVVRLLADQPPQALARGLMQAVPALGRLNP